MYLELKSKGIEFPAQDLDSMAPIHTPQRSVIPQQHPSSRSGSLTSSTTTRPVDTGPVRLSPEQMEKLQQELTIVQGNITVFEEMLNELVPGQEHADDWTLLEELNATCRSMQQRIVELIDRVSNEDVTVELLRVNDSLNNCFLRYDRFVKKRNKGVPSPVASQPQFPIRSSQGTATRPPVESSLIDLGDDDAPPSASGGDALVGNLSSLRIGPGQNRPQSDDFDAFAHSRSVRNGTPQRKPDGYSESLAREQVDTSLASLTQAKAQRDLSEAGLIDKKEDLDEMEKWLMEQEKTTANASTGTGPTTATVDSSEFERFLYERATAVDSSQRQQAQPSKSQGAKDPFDL